MNEVKGGMLVDWTPRVKISRNRLELPEASEATDLSPSAVL